MRTRFFLAVHMLICTPVFASSLDINAHSDALRLSYASYVNTGTISDYGILLLDGNGQAGKDEVAIHAGLNAEFDNIRIGARAFYVSPGSYDLLAVGFGLQAKTYFSKRAILSGHFYYAPEFSSLLDSSRYTEFVARFNYKMMRNAQVYIGYRSIKVRIENANNSIEIDDELHVGLKLYF